MKKKLLLLPVILMSGVLTACGIKIDHVSLKEMYDTKKFDNYASCNLNFPGVGVEYVNDDNQKIFNILKGYTYDAEMIGKIDTYSSITYDKKTITYSFDIEDRPKKMCYFEMRFYDNGRIETYAAGNGSFFYPKEQYTAYKIDESVAKSLFTEVTDYALEYTRNRVKQDTRIEDFTERLTYNRVNDFGLRIQTNEEPPRQLTYDVVDKTGAVLNVFKEIKFETTDVELEVNLYKCISIAANSYWRMFIDYENCNGYMKYEYDSPLEEGGHGTVMQFFRANRPGVTNLYGTIFDMISDQYERDTQR